MLKHVLLVDDSAISRVMLKSLIEDNYANVCVAEAETAEVAIELCEQQKYEGIFLDLNMPGEDGLTVAPKLQELCPNVRIALLTANFQERVQIKAEDLGLSFYAKPVTLDKVTDFMTAQSS